MNIKYLVIIAAFLVIISGCNVYQPATAQNTWDGEKVKVDFYVMSQCPYGTQVVDAIKPVLDDVGYAVDFNLEYISTDMGDGTFRSLHGEPETKGNIVQLCAAKYEPEKYMDMIVCQNTNAGGIPDNWKACAEENGLDVSTIETCYTGDEGKQLLSVSAANSGNVGATGSPTIYLEDQPYSGGRTSNDFMRAICYEFNQDKRPEPCLLIPEPKEVNMTIVSDSRCDTCQYNSLVGQIKAIMPGLEYDVVDFNTAEGKAYYDTLGISLLPAFIFDDSVIDSEGYASVKDYLQPTLTGETSLRIAASFDPYKEICDNEQDDYDNDGLVDCDDDECSTEYTCMKKSDVVDVELFVMSHCPYGTQVEKGILPVVKALGDNINFTVRYLDYAMHGEVEVNEQLQQYCIQSEQNDKLIPYLECFLEAGDSETCLKSAEVDTEMLEACSSKVDAEFNITADLKDQSRWGGYYPPFNIDKDTVEKYGISGSPGLAVNGVVADIGRSLDRAPKFLLETICYGFNEEPAECSTELDYNAPGPGFGFDTTAESASGGNCG